jgi:hypothetical protein
MTEANHPGCRVSRVRTKAGADISILKTELKDNRFIRTLIHMLDKARKGDVRSFAMVVRIERDDGNMAWVEAADVLSDEDGGDVYMLLGGMEAIKARLIAEHADKGTPP